MDSLSARVQLDSIAAAALQEVHGGTCVARFLQRQPVPAPTYLIAVGKAAVAMTAGAFAACKTSIAGGLVVTKYGHTQGMRADWPVQLLEAAHPLPDEMSLRAGSLLLDYLQTWPADAHLLVLLSGGSSALLECPVPGVSLLELREANRWLMGSGLDITGVNAVRSRLSTIKGGGLLHHFRGRRVTQLLLSDVPGDRVESIGSGPLVAATAALPPDLPIWLDRLARLSPPLEPSSPAHVHKELVGTNAMARRRAMAEVQARGLPVRENAELFTDIHDAAEQISRRLRQDAGFYIWGGENTVRLPAQIGRGGRNQMLGLLLAQQLSGAPFCCLCLATDGTDGPTDAAGAMVDGETVARGRALGLDAASSLRAFDAGTYLESCGDLVRTGPTGTNVMDLTMALTWR